MLTITRISALFFLLWTGLSAFTLTPSLVPEDEIISGGPGKDGIPALTFPRHEPSKSGDIWLKPDDLVIGIHLNQKARAYPVRILNWHEIVNDRIGDHAFVITYCPLCGSALAFDTADRFGVSGLLYQSDVLLYDHRTESLWSQLRMQAVARKRAGEKLKPIPVEHTSWQEWKSRHPDTLVLSRHTGFPRNYDRNPYAGYESTPATYFPVGNRDHRLPAKAWVVGLSLNGKHKAWPLAALRRTGSHSEPWQGRTLHFQVSGEGVRISDHETGQALPAIRLYWFAWSAFHPDSALGQ